MKDFDVSKHVNELLSIIKIEDDDDRMYVRGLIDGMNIAIAFFNEVTDKFSEIHEGLKRELFQDESDSHPEQTS